MNKSLIAGVIGTIQIGLIFIIYFIIYDSLSPLATTPQAQAILEQGEQDTINAFNWWLLIDSVGGLILLFGLIFGIIYAVIKIVENETGGVQWA